MIYPLLHTTALQQVSPRLSSSIVSPSMARRASLSLAVSLAVSILVLATTLPSAHGIFCKVCVDAVEEAATEKSVEVICDAACEEVDDLPACTAFCDYLFDASGLGDVIKTLLSSKHFRVELRSLQSLAGGSLRLNFNLTQFP